MNKSASLAFPFRMDLENDCLKRTHTVEEMVLSAIRIFLMTRRGSRLGNPVGSFLPELLLQTVPISSLPALSQELKKELITNFPGVDFLNVELLQDRENNVVDLVVKITFTTPYQQNMSDVSIVLPSVFAPNQNFENRL